MVFRLRQYVPDGKTRGHARLASPVRRQWATGATLQLASSPTRERLVPSSPHACKGRSPNGTGPHSSLLLMDSMFPLFTNVFEGTALTWTSNSQHPALPR